MSVQTLARRTMGAGSIWIFAVGASSPLTVLVGGIPQTYANTGVLGVPLSFAVLAAVLGLLAVGYLAMSRHVVHGAPFYALLARGLNPTAGLGGALVALLGYNAIQISLYGLVGTTLAGVFGGPWQVWAAAVWLIVGTLGLLAGAVSAKILGTLLALELGVITFFDLASFAHPATGHVAFAGVEPSHLLVSGVSGVLAFSTAAFIGVETPPAYSEEARPGAVGTAMAIAIGFLGSFYLLAAWAYQTWVGSAEIVAASADPTRTPLALLGTVFGPGVTNLAQMLLVTSIIASMLAFHGAVARYIFAMAREHVLPSALAGVSGTSRRVRGGAPKAGSLVQSAIAFIVLGVFILLKADPIAVIFTWLSTIAAVAILVLLVVTSLAARQFFINGGGAQESRWVRHIAPVSGAVIGTFVTIMMVANLGSLLGTAPGSLWPWLVPVLIVVVGLTGLAWGAWLRRHRRLVWEALGQGAPDPMTVNDPRLSLLGI